MELIEPKNISSNNNKLKVREIITIWREEETLKIKKQKKNYVEGKARSQQMKWRKSMVNVRKVKLK